MLKKASILLLLSCMSILLLGLGCQKPSEVCFKEKCFQVEIANSPETRETGLMFREALEDDAGMLFIFPQEGLYSFWMKNTKIALDIVWIDSNSKVIFINRDTQPCQEEQCPTITPHERAKYVLEIKAGKTREIGLNNGDILTINVPQEIIKSAR